MTLAFSDGNSFSEGATPYQLRPATDWDQTERIFVPIAVEGIQTEAVLDTGGSFLICDPGLVEVLEIDPEAAIGHQEVMIVAAEGDSYPFQATAFVPELPWPLPTYMGWFGCLERIRLAIDPNKETLHFGPI